MKRFKTTTNPKKMTVGTYFVLIPAHMASQLANDRQADDFRLLYQVVETYEADGERWVKFRGLGSGMIHNLPISAIYPDDDQYEGETAMKVHGILHVVRKFLQKDMKWLSMRNAQDCVYGRFEFRLPGTY